MNRARTVDLDLMFAYFKSRRLHVSHTFVELMTSNFCTCVELCIETREQYIFELVWMFFFLQLQRKTT